MATFNWKKEYTRYQHYLTDIVSMYQSKPDVRASLNIFFSLLTVALLVYFALRPTLITIGSLLKEIEQKEALVVQMDEKIDALNRAQSLMAKEKDNIDLLNKAIPDEPEAVEFGRQLEGLSVLSQVDVGTYSVDSVDLVQEDKKEEVTPRKVRGLSDESTIDFSFVASSADYTRVRDMAQKLEQLLRPVYLEDLSFSSKTLTSGEGPKINLIFSIKVPYLGKGN